MADDADYIRRGFVAERRSLLVVSFILFFYHRAGLRIDEINVFGNKVSLDDPWWITFALWVLWFYFFVRFYQYFRSIPGKGFRRAYEWQMTKSITRSAFKHFKKHFMKFVAEKNAKYDFKISTAEFLLSYPKQRTIKLNISIVQVDETGGIEAPTRTHQEDFASWELLWAKIKSVAHVFVSTHVGTEYFLPFLLALLPLINVLYESLGSIKLSIRFAISLLTSGG